jgi:hypothetical protein
LPGWADSEAGLEDQLEAHRDSIMPLDEVADGEQKMPLEKKVRMLSFLIARNRPRKLSKHYEREIGAGGREFRTIVLSSSERSFRTIARRAGEQRLGGEEVRFIDVRATEPGSLGIFDGHVAPQSGQTADETAKEIIERLRANARKHQGHVYLEFWQKYQRDPSAALAAIRRYKQEFERKMKAAGPTNILRIRSNFAVIWAAGALAIDYGVLPWKKKVTFLAIEKCFRSALKTLAVSKKPLSADRRVARALRKRLRRAHLVTLRARTAHTQQQIAKHRNADGFVIGKELLINARRLNHWLPNRSDRLILAHRKILRTARSDTLTIEKTIPGIKGKPRYYVFRRTALESYLSEKVRRKALVRAGALRGTEVDQAALDAAVYLGQVANSIQKSPMSSVPFCNDRSPKIRRDSGVSSGYGNQFR